MERKPIKRKYIVAKFAYNDATIYCVESETANEAVIKSRKLKNAYATYTGNFKFYGEGSFAIAENPEKNITLDSVADIFKSMDISNIYLLEYDKNYLKKEYRSEVKKH